MNILSTLPWLISAVGAYFIFRLKGFFILHPIRSILPVFKGSASDMSALALALAGTLGVGNILGVSVGIAVGGAGSVLWLLISAVFSSAIKYCEVCLSVDEVKTGGEGLISLVRRGFGRLGKALSVIFTLLCLLLSLTMGSALQCSAISEGASSSLGIEPYHLLLPVLLAVAFLTLGGGEKIEKWTSIIIPLTTIIYIFLCFLIILPNFDRLPSVITKIISEALHPKSTAGGILGFMLSKPISEGYARGILSNEAGAGTSSFAHIRSSERSAHSAGLFGILEVLFDTVFLCSITAFAILTGLDEEALSEGGFLIGKAVSSGLGAGGGITLFACIFLFAIATVICWYYYGSTCFIKLLGDKFAPLYFPIFLISSAFGILFDADGLILIIDILLFTLSLITLSTLLIYRERIIEIHTLGLPNPQKQKTYK